MPVRQKHGSVTEAQKCQKVVDDRRSQPCLQRGQGRTGYSVDLFHGSYWNVELDSKPGQSIGETSLKGDVILLALETLRRCLGSV